MATRRARVQHARPGGWWSSRACPKLGPYADCMRSIFTDKKEVKITWGNFLDGPSRADIEHSTVFLGAQAFQNNVAWTNQDTHQTLYFHWLDSLSFTLAHELIHICGAPDDDVSTDANDYAAILFGGPPLISADPRP